MHYRPFYSLRGACQPPYIEMHVANELQAKVIILLQRPTRDCVQELNRARSGPAMSSIHGRWKKISPSSCRLGELHVHLCFSCSGVCRSDASVGCRRCWVKEGQRREGNRGLSGTQGSERLCGVHMAKGWCLHLSLDSPSGWERNSTGQF